jgi:hypothetical protein
MQRTTIGVSDSTYNNTIYKGDEVSGAVRPPGTVYVHA